MADLASLLRTRRVQVWGGLALALGIAILLLALAERSRSDGDPGGTTPPKERGPITVRVVDAESRPVFDARPFVLESGETPDEGAAVAVWSPDEATLTLPREGIPHSVVVQARGYLTRQLDDIRGDRLLVLLPGLLARIGVKGDPELPAEPVGLYFKINPLGAEGADLGAAQRNTILDLMDTRIDPPASLPPFPREGFGFLVSRAQAEAGLVLPLAGRYRVQWGLMNEKRGTWYTLPQGSDVVIAVEDEPPEQAFDIEISTADAARAKADLDEMIRRQSGG